jgi:hypothetical protein
VAFNNSCALYILIDIDFDGYLGMTPMYQMIGNVFTSIFQSSAELVEKF